MELFFYYLVLVAIAAATLLSTRTRQAGRFQWELTPELALPLSFFAYTSAMPISRIFWQTPPKDLDIEFLQIHTLAALCLGAGIAAGKIFGGSWFSRIRASRPATRSTMRPTTCAFLAVGALVAIVFIIYRSVGYSFTNMLQKYTFETTVAQEQTTADTLAYPAAIACLLHCYLGACLGLVQRPRLRRLVMVVAFVAAGFLLLRGFRNLVTMMLLPIAVMTFYKRPLPIARTLIVAFASLTLFSAVAVTRNWTFGAEDRAPVTLETMDPDRGELGTSYNVFSIFRSFGEDKDLQYGKTYTVAFATNLVPIALWPDRPKSTAFNFSSRYFQTDQLTVGLGYSPVVEALTNFSVIGIVPIFVGFGMFITVLARYLLTKGRWGLLSYSMMIPMLINWNRIDACTAGKIFFVYLGLFVVIDKILYVRPVD
jgi:hypothetical protein